MLTKPTSRFIIIFFMYASTRIQRNSIQVILAKQFLWSVLEESQVSTPT